MIKPNFSVIVPYFRFLLVVLSCPFYTINLFQESNKLPCIHGQFVCTPMHESICEVDLAELFLLIEDSLGMQALLRKSMLV